jgi:uncharacterized protein (DUF1697 family)
MKKRPQDTFIALLRGINVGGHHKVPMSELRSLCADSGWANVQTYVQSGNLIFSATATPAVLEAELERSLEKRFGFSVPVIVRAASSWPAYVKSNPFSAASKKEPKLVMLALAKAPPNVDAVNGLRERASKSERIERAGDALWIHFGGGVARSKLTPALLDRLVGSPVTMRNWRTVLTLGKMAGQMA